MTAPTSTGDPMTNLTTIANDIFEANASKGFWDRERLLTETTMLIVTELAEAVEEERAGNAGIYYRDTQEGKDLPERDVHIGVDSLARPDYWTPAPLKPEGVDVELIDALIRLLDLLGSRGVDVDDLLKQKLAYNATRPARHGKAY